MLVGQGRTVKDDIVTTLYQQRRKIFDVEVTDDIGAIFDIDPQK